MVKLIIAVLAGLGMGLGIAYITLNGSESTPTVEGASGGEWQARIVSLERQLAEEIAARRQMQMTLERLVDQSAPFELVVEEDDSAAALTADAEIAPNGEAEVPSRRESLGEETAERSSPLSRQSRLEKAGFLPDQAERIIEREKALRLESLYDQWQRRRENYLENGADRQATNSLRAELGEQGYERYLEAFGRPTRVEVRELMAQSPAADAGFQAGDQIVRYNGERIFNVWELNAATVKGDRGEPVIVDVVRDGVPMQLTIERGPLGIISRPGRPRSRP